MCRSQFPFAKLYIFRQLVLGVRCGQKCLENIGKVNHMCEVHRLKFMNGIEIEWREHIYQFEKCNFYFISSKITENNK